MEPKPYPVLGVPFDFLAEAEAAACIAAWKGESPCRMVMITNPHSVMLCKRQKSMADAARRASLILPDGVGIVLAAQVLGYPHHGRVTGPSLMLRVCDLGRASGLRHFFYGGGDGVAEQLAARLGERFPGLEIAGCITPPFRQLTEPERDEILREIRDSRADVLWVGLGAPKQEAWILENLDRLPVSSAIGVGAAFDFHSGAIRWAPEWIRRMGLEWAFRLLLEPRRLIRRNLDSPIFMMRVLGQRLLGKCKSIG